MCKQTVRAKFITEWEHEVSNIEQHPILRMYTKIKMTFGMEPYMKYIKNVKYRTALSRFRMSSHCLQIERGRHQRPKQAIKDRICFKCNVVEDEYHFLLQCQLYMADRQELFDKVTAKDHNFGQLNNEDIFIYLLKSEDEQILSWLGKFVHTSFSKRAELLTTSNDSLCNNMQPDIRQFLIPL